MGWFGPQSGVCTCCNDGPPPEDTCDFDCTGDEPEMLGVEVELGSTGTSGCTCSGEGTYLFPAPTYVQRPGLTGSQSNCLHCWEPEPLGTCCALLQRVLKATEEQYGGLPATLLAPCGTHADEFTGYSYGYYAQLYFDFFIYGIWDATLCVQFKDPNLQKFTYTINGSTQIASRAIICETRYRRQWKMVKQPGSFPGPEGDDWCTWEPEWVDADWEYEPGYDGTECPPPDSECIGAAVCASTGGSFEWAGEFAITNCSEILTVRGLTKGTVPAGMSGSCCVTETFVGTEYTHCYNYTGVSIDWGCAPNYVNVNVVPAP